MQVISCEGVSAAYKESYGDGAKMMADFCADVADAILEQLLQQEIGDEFHLYFLPNGEKAAICSYHEEPRAFGWEIVWPQNLQTTCGMMERHHIIKWVGDLIGGLPILNME